MKKKMALLLSAASIVFILAFPAYAGINTTEAIYKPLTHGAGG